MRPPAHESAVQSGVAFCVYANTAPAPTREDVTEPALLKNEKRMRMRLTVYAVGMRSLQCSRPPYEERFTSRTPVAPLPKALYPPLIPLRPTS